MLRTACAQAKAWQNAGLAPMRVAVNLRALGCDRFPGYYYSPAVDAVEARRFMAAYVERRPLAYA